MPQGFLEQLSNAGARGGSCTLCTLETYQATRYLEGVANDGVNDVPLRKRLMQQGGYCPRHCEEFAKITLILPTAILFEDFLKTRLENARSGRRPTRVDCEACEVETKTRDLLEQNIRRHKGNSEVQTAFLETPLCLTHLELICRHLPDGVRKALVERHETLMGHLEELIRKHDYRFTGEKIFDEERASLKEALKLLGVNKP